MYVPKRFAVEDLDRCCQLMQDFPLATLIQNTSSGLQANHIPMLVARDGDELILRGHVARGNPLWKEHDQPILAVFQGGSTYLSPSWYASKEVHGKVVPTWNYGAVHISGTLEIHDDVTWLRQLLADMTAVQEVDLSTPWTMEDAPPQYMEAMLRAVVGIEIKAQRIEAKWKADQSESAQDRASVCHALRAQGAPNQQLMASWMEELAPRPAE